MTDTVLAEILARLDLVVFERLPGGAFVRIGSAQPPSWFNRLFPDASRSEPVAIAEAMPFLEHFLADAEDVWRAGNGERLRSDPFTMTDRPDGEVALVASAVVAADRCFLIIELPADFAERRRALQTARDNVLEHETHLERTGALMTPVDAAVRLMQQLTTSGLTPEQHELAAGIGRQLASLAASIESLAPLPKGVSRRSRR